MLKKERQNTIMEILKERNFCTVRYLSDRLYAAPITIRRDLETLEKAGLVERCYGGVGLPSHENREVPFEVRNRSNFSAKEAIAKQAVSYVHNGDVVFMDASSTVSHMIEYLTPEQNLTVITNSILVAEKMQEKRIRVYLTGGMPVENSHALVGSIAEQTVTGIFANVCFFSAQGVDADGNVSDQSEAETALRRRMLANSQKQVFLFDSSKYEKRFAFRLCNLSEITAAVTDQPEVCAVLQCIREG